LFLTAGNIYYRGIKNNNNNNNNNSYYYKESGVCGQQPQTVEHLLPVTRFTGSLIQLQQLTDEEAIDWISRWSKAYEK